MTNIPQIIDTAIPQLNIFTFTMFIYFRRGIIRGTGKGLSIANSAALTSIVAYLILFPILLHQMVYVRDMGLQGIWISRAITEFFIGTCYDIVICFTDIEEVIWKNRERMAEIEDMEAEQEKDD